MLTYIVLALLIGILLGILTGLSPGLHINLISVLLLSLATTVSGIVDPVYIVILIIGMAVTHTFLDFIPNTYLGAPEADTALSVLPAHRFLKQGEGYTAIKLSTIGSLAGLLLATAFTPLAVYLGLNHYDLIKDYIPYLLIASIIFLLIKEKGNKWSAILIVLLSGVLGILVLNLPSLSNPLFPLLTGLFGVSTLLISLKDKTNIPKQNVKDDLKLDKKEATKAISSSFIVSLVAGFVPGIASSQSAIISSSFFKKLKSEYFIIMTGLINTVIMITSFAALYSIGKARNGAVIVVSKILEGITLDYLIIFIAASLFVGGIATILSLKIAKVFSKYITKINYKKVSITIISILLLLVLVLTGPIGLLIAGIATAVGVLPPLLNVGKNHLMSCLMIPIVLFFIL